MKPSRPLFRLFPAGLATAFVIATGVALAAAPGEDAFPIREYRLGATTHFGQRWVPDAIIPLIAEAGIGWIRDEIYPHHLSQPSPGVYEAGASTRHWIDLASHYNLKVVVILNDGRPSPGKPRLYERPDDYARAAAAIATQFRGKIHAIEVLNEPPHFGFMEAWKAGGASWSGLNPDGSVQLWIKKYVELLNATAIAVKAVNPDVKVIGCGANTQANYRMLREGVSPLVDGITDHPYSFQTVPELIPDASSPAALARDGFPVADAIGNFTSLISHYRAESLRTKGPRELWLTEWGWPSYSEGSHREPPSRQFNSGYSALYTPCTLHAQAAYTLRRYIESIATGVDVSVIYDFKDDGESRFNAEHNFGLVDYSLQPKPVYRALQRAIQALATLSPAPASAVRTRAFPFSERRDPRPITWNATATLRAPGDIRMYPFSDGKGGLTTAIWSAERAGNDMSPRAADIELVTGVPFSEVTATDLLTGDTEKITGVATAAGILLKRFPVPDYPVLVRLPVAATQESTTALSPGQSETPLSPTNAPAIAWRFYAGDAPERFAKGKITQASDANGGPFFTLDYDFGKTGVYAAVVTDKLSVAGANDIRFSIKNSSPCRLLLRVADKSGEIFQYTIIYDADEEWRDYRRDFDAGQARSVFGGDKNSRFDLPVTQVWIGLENPLRIGHPASGTLQVRDIGFRR
ncbi:hypothetical protein OpiT1DRAFT_05220 [Opitutaceae bacterium TAV1]|nr:hypothetical protein OpiT1DRAFT_05220 [Opitutaceae bacterium TAV1]